MTKSMQEMIEAANNLTPDCFGSDQTSADLRAIIKQEFADWSDNEVDDVMLLAEHVASMQAYALRCARWQVQTGLTAMEKDLRVLRREAQRRKRSSRKATVEQPVAPTLRVIK